MNNIVFLKSYRTARISIVAFAFVATYLLLSVTVGVGTPQTINGVEVESLLPISASPNDAPIHTQQQPLIRIFYNLFIQKPEDEGRVLRMFDEQFRVIDPKLHDMSISINSIGYKSSHIPNQYVAEHHSEGGEDLTLHSLYQYCLANNNNTDAKVVYLHSKGSFHPDENNDKLRQFLTEGALSKECANLPTECDVCSSRMSPHPHPHTSGNMWLARCSYITKLIDPFARKEGKLPSLFDEDNGCKGYGRYFFEHWVYSHPSVRPCDLYTGKEYTWAYENIPETNFEKELQMAPRFDFGVFVDLILKKYWYCRKDTKSVSRPKSYLENRMANYKSLYNVTNVGDSWYLWKFLNDSLSVG